ncbi:hypothetical protein EDI_129870 [Entamoeba dispar SAW760]|uniref:Uncharacterized protein n=1 Tax=Entamoeba dispar (strain ATCC PRA-260 / SAW760) TaxID=370354 RepID=B0EDP0_ENTDS|nr:uncharacterized protein EDI_129870 [Entamoeba dispar SAW760]EDR27360.1 hypothetical protein EDI_129870 [Entamoeba dispar SAW760]|eukprot:EDR27360.1 hypothetical protein EDI_129870 [Entamoeba dispar SAW760]
MIYSLFIILLAEVFVDSFKYMLLRPFKIPSLNSITTSDRRLGVPVVFLSVLFICFGLKTMSLSHLTSLYSFITFNTLFVKRSVDYCIETWLLLK